MPHTLFLQINPDDCLAFLKQARYQKDLSMRQNSFIEKIDALDHDLTQLKLLNSFEFTEKEKNAIERGAHYALTKSLEEKFKQQHVLTLADLQSTLNEEFHINDKTAIDFIIKSILDNGSIPFALSLLSFFPLETNDSFFTNNSIGPRFKHSLKARPGSRKATIIFEQELIFKNSLSHTVQGFAQLQFSVDQQKRIQLLPLTIEFDFVDKQECTQFKNKLCRDFQDWIFQPKTYWQTIDLWVIPSLLSCLVGLSAMISLIALGLTPISPLLLPPIGLALGLFLSSIMHAYVHSRIKKDHEKSQRPIYLFSRKPISPITFFNHPMPVESSITAETQFACNK